MLSAAARAGRTGPGGVAGLLLADCHRLPLPLAAVDGVFTVGPLDHVSDPAAAPREWARVTAPVVRGPQVHPVGFWTVRLRTPNGYLLTFEARRPRTEPSAGRM
jgi:ubiquinone/menaquinone biosynthesis C-methylase UbiE